MKQGSFPLFRTSFHTLLLDYTGILRIHDFPLKKGSGGKSSVRTKLICSHDMRFLKCREAADPHKQAETGFVSIVESNSDPCG